MLSLDLLPAAHGDCLWIDYGDGQATHHILIDGGPAHTYPQLRERILQWPPEARRFELLVITHIDGDHIEGIVRLLQDAEALNCHFERIWFNGSPQLDRVDDPAGPPLGPQQGEMLGWLIAQYETRTGQAVWNRDLPDALAMVQAGGGPLPSVTLAGGCTLTLLSPDAARLLALKDQWRQVLDKAGWVAGDEAAVQQALQASRNLQPLGDVLGDDETVAASPLDAGRYETPDPLGRDQLGGLNDVLGDSEGEPGQDAPLGGDTSVANGSSIALLLEMPRGNSTQRLLLAGDAWPQVLEASIDRLLAERGAQRLVLQGFKLPHHGSVANVTAELLDKLKCSRYLVSTSGAVFRHPHARTIELLLAHHAGAGKPQLCFNYLTETTQPWSDGQDQAQRRYMAMYPKGLSLSW